MPKVLIVDDEEDILWGLSEELTRDGIDVDTASNGQEAFEKIKDTDYDFLITDIRMPGMSGSELLLKSKKLRPDLKVIVMTAYGSDELRQEVLSHGAISYLEKPFDFEQLLELIKEKEKKTEETISKLSLNQFLQLVSMEGQSCTVTVKTEVGEGKIYFIDGEVVNTEFNGLTGEEAFVSIMKFQNPPFDVEWGVPQTKRTIEKPLHALLLSAVAKKEESEAGVPESEEIGGEEVDLSALSNLFGEDEGVAEEVKEENVEEEAEVTEKQTQAPESEEEEINLENLSFEDEGVVEEEVKEEAKPEEEQVEEVIEEPEKEEEEEFSLENLESMLSEEVGKEVEEEEKEVSEEEVKEEAKPEEEKVEKATEEPKEEEKEEEFSLENLESMLSEEVGEEVEEEEKEVSEKEVKEEVKSEEEVVEEAEKEEVAEEAEEKIEPEEEQVEKVASVAEESQVETPPKAQEGSKSKEEVEEVKEEEKEEVEVEEEVKASVEQPAETKKGALVVPEEKKAVIEDILRKMVSLTTDIKGGFIADINGNIAASHFKSGSLKGDELGYLGEHAGMIFEILKQATGQEIEDITISLKDENLMGAPVLDGDLFVFVSTSKKTLKLALIKAYLKKTVASLTKELS